MRLIAIDIDEVVADLHNPWLRWLRLRWGPRAPKQFTNWNVEKDLEPIGNTGPLDFIEPSIYDGRFGNPLNVRPRAREAVEVLRKAHAFSIVWATTCIHGTEVAKLSWLVSKGLWQEGDVYLPTRQKEQAFDLGAKYLIDDSPKNLEGWPGIGILIDRPHNRGYEYPRRAENLLAATRLVR